MTGVDERCPAWPDRRRAGILLLACAAALLLPGAPVRAQVDRAPGIPRHLKRRRWRELREAVRRGEIRPLRELMRYFEYRTGGEIIDVRYHRAGPHHLYAFKTLTREGHLRWFAIDAATREIMTAEQAKKRYGR